MNTILVLAQHPSMAEAVAAALDAEKYRVLHRATVEEAEPLIVHGLANAIIGDVETASVQGAWLVEKLRRRAPKCPLILYTTVNQPEWEEQAYLQGATHVLAKPFRPRLLE